MRIRNEVLAFTAIFILLSFVIVVIDPARDFLIWNMGLSIIPYFLSVLLRHSRPVYASKVLFVLIFLAWLAFYPNAVYMVTDFIHFSTRTFYTKTPRIQYNMDIRLWLNFSFSVCAVFFGVFLGMASLFHVEEALLQKKPFYMRILFYIVISVLTGFAIYIGRFIRLNSWDVLLNPGELLREVGATINRNTAMLTFLFSSIHFFLAVTAKLFRSTRHIPGVSGHPGPRDA